jgi:hypothetical protein
MNHREGPPAAYIIIVLLLTGLCGELVELGGGDTGVKALDDLHRDPLRADIVRVETVAKLLDARRDLVELNLLDPIGSMIYRD